MMDTITCLDIQGNEYQIPIGELQWRPSAYGIIIDDNKVLMLREFGDMYALPGGGVDLGEDLESAVIREVKEETGLEVINPKNIGVETSFFHSHDNKKSYHSILLYYVCEIAGGELSTDGFDEYEQQHAEMAEWIPIDLIDSIKIASTVDFRPYVKLAAQRQ